MNVTNFHKTLMIDIETVPLVKSFDQLNEHLQNHWLNKSASLARFYQTPEEPKLLFEEKAGIYAEFGKIVCISVGYLQLTDNHLKLNIKSYYNHDEHVLLQQFFEMVFLLEAKHKNVIFCGHNILEFDLPFIARKAIIHQLALPNSFQLQGIKPWNNPHLDTMELWRFGDYKHYTSLDLLATLLNVPSSKMKLDGSKVAAAYWESDDLESIKTYCEQDIITTTQVYLKLKNLSYQIEVNDANS